MNYNEFKALISEEIKKSFQGYETKEERVQKLQNQSYNGLVVKEADSIIGMTLNLDAYYKQLEDGRDWADLVSEVIDTVKNAEFPVVGMNMESLKDYQQLKDKLITQMVPIEGNEEMLSKVPHKTMYDLAVVYRIMLRGDSDGEASILLTNENLLGFGVTAEQLEVDAKAVCEKNHPLSVRPMESVLFGVSEEDVEGPSLWVISNDTGRYGASVVAYPKALEEIAEKVGSGFYLIPSSIHEMLAMPDVVEMKAKDLDLMVVGVNNTEVAPAERLADHSYHYDKEAKLFERGTVYEERKAKELEEQKPQEDAKEQAADAVHEDCEEYHVEETATVLLVEPGEYPKIVEIGMELKDLQQAVGGYIEATYPFEDDMACVICNEEGKLNGMELNRGFYDKQGNLEDIIAGPFIVAGLNSDGFGSLTEEQLRRYEQLFHQPEAFVNMGNHFMAVPVKDKEKAAVKAEETA